MVCLPVIFFAVGVILLIVSWERHKQRIAYSSTLILGVLALLFPIMLCILLALATRFHNNVLIRRLKNNVTTDHRQKVLIFVGFCPLNA